MYPLDDITKSAIERDFYEYLARCWHARKAAEARRRKQSGSRILLSVGATFERRKRLWKLARAERGSLRAPGLSSGRIESNVPQKVILAS